MVEYNTDVLQTEEPTASRATRGVHDSVGVKLGKSKAIFSLILVLVIRFRLIILDVWSSSMPGGDIESVLDAGWGCPGKKWA